MTSYRKYPGDIIITYNEPLSNSLSELNDDETIEQSHLHDQYVNNIKIDKYVQSVKDKFEERSQTGIKKYNTTLERDDLNFLDWLQHLQEELMDATLYIERLKTSYVEETAKKSTRGLES